MQLISPPNVLLMNNAKNSSAKATILVADDDPFIRRLLTYQLTKEGYVVLTAQDGRQALDWLHQDQHKPDLVLIDLLMPQYSGLEVIAKIKTLARRLPVILMSVAEEHIAHQGVSSAQPDLFLKKPISTDQLLLSIQTVLCAQSAEYLMPSPPLF